MSASAAARWGVECLLVLLSVGGGCAGPTDSARDETRWIDDGGLFSPGFGAVSFVARDGNELEARTYRSTGFDPDTGPIWFVMHGADRDADRYIDAAAPVAERHGALAIVIRFSQEGYPDSEDYTLGVYAADVPSGSRGDGRFRAPEDMLYAEVERVFDLVLASLGGDQAGYYLLGHSAGAQFVHRLLTFLPEPRALVAVAANAGWYTLPAAEDPEVHTMPYGLIDSPVDPSDLAGLFATPLVVLLSEHDTTTAATDDLVRGTPAAEAQGENRLERGLHYFAVAEARAADLGMDFAWQLEIVPEAGHDVAEVIPTAGVLTFSRDEQACIPSSPGAASRLAITEVLADPPDGAAGDANGDGVRDPEADEFVELVNEGLLPVCLAGWTLGDDASAARHVFPPGPALEPGEVAVVFGGGVPTGPFAGARVERAAHGLSLQNAGDVLTLRDAEGEVVQQVSWGDCAERPCAEDHWAEGLGFGGSLVRTPAPEARWRLHTATSGARFSPGAPTAYGARP